MKKLLLTAFAITTAVSVFAQGTVTFQNRLSATSLQTHVYMSPAGVSSSVTGNGANDAPAGTQNWTGYTALSGSGYLAALLSAPGTGNPLSSMSWGSLVAPFRTGSGAGYISGGGCTLGNVAKDAASATLQMFAWDNSSGQYATPAAGYTAWQAGTIAGGLSNPFLVNSIGGDFNVPPTFAGSALTSFNIYLVPEPTTMALAGLGAAALLIFRRRS